MAGPISPETSVDMWSFSVTAISNPEVRKHLNAWFQIKDPALRQQYNRYLEQSRTTIFLNILALGYLIILLPMTIITCVGEFESDSNALDVISSALLLVCSLAGLLASWALVLMTNGFSFGFLSPTNFNVHKLRRILFCASSFYSSILFCKRNLFPRCSANHDDVSGHVHGFDDTFDNHLWMHYNCEHGIVQSIVMTYQAASLFMVLMALVVNLSSIPFEFVCAMYFMECIVVIVATARIEDPHASFLSIAFWFLSTIATIADVHFRNLLHFLSVEREKIQSEQFTAELKHTIANVAHDLKTPLSSFTNGVDLLQILWNDIQDCLRQSNFENVCTFSQQVSDCLRNIRCTNTFMTMAINRCLDSTKASNNMKLLPKNESVDLMEVVSLPLSIMQTVQTKVGLRLELDSSVGNFVTTHIITDQQWLQENILCLLSNAVKYSSKGVVIIRILYSTQSDASEDAHGGSGTIEPLATGSSTLTAMVSLTAAPSMNNNSVVDSSGGEEGGLSVSGGGGSGHFSSHEAASRGFLVFQVEDEGIGIAPSARARLFHPFQQTQRLAGGTGLGLYSLAKRIEAIKGQYGMRDRTDGGQGSMFWFSVPYRPDFVLSEERFITLNSANSVPNVPVFSLPSTSNNSPMYIPKHSPRTLAHAAALQLHRSKHCAADGTISTPQDESLLPTTDSAASHSARSMTSSSALAPATSPERRLEVLLVDDSPTIIKMTSIMLDRIGCNVSTAENGADAIDKLLIRLKEVQSARPHSCSSHIDTVPESDNRVAAFPSIEYPYNAVETGLLGSSEKEGPTHSDNAGGEVWMYDIILMDLQMPVLDGLEATRRIRQMKDPRLKSIFIVGLSANSDDDTLQAAYDAGVDRFLPKPFTINTFLSLVRDCFPHNQTLLPNV